MDKRFGKRLTVSCKAFKRHDSLWKDMKVLVKTESPGLSIISHRGLEHLGIFSITGKLISSENRIQILFYYVFLEI